MGDVTNVAAASGLIDRYKIKDHWPTDGSDDGPVLIDANTTLSGLTPGTEYEIEVESIIDACGSVPSTSTTNITSCTG